MLRQSQELRKEEGLLVQRHMELPKKAEALLLERQLGLPRKTEANW